MNDLPQRKFQLIKLLVLFLVFSVLAAYSSSKPDGLERILQIFSLNKTSPADDVGLFSDYVISPGFSEIQNEFLSALLGIGIITVLVFLIYKISLMLRKRDRTDNAT